MESLEKNSKYKLIHYKNRHFIIDINRSKLTFIFPLLNYITKQLLIEIDENEINKVKIGNLTKDVKRDA
ncbi:DUF443 family protein, partial [Staphylococcus epidermidis]